MRKTLVVGPLCIVCLVGCASALAAQDKGQIQASASPVVESTPEALALARTLVESMADRTFTGTIEYTLTTKVSSGLTPGQPSPPVASQLWLHEDGSRRRDTGIGSERGPIVAASHRGTAWMVFQDQPSVFMGWARDLSSGGRSMEGELFHQVRGAGIVADRILNNGILPEKINAIESATLEGDRLRVRLGSTGKGDEYGTIEVLARKHPEWGFFVPEEVRFLSVGSSLTLSDPERITPTKTIAREIYFATFISSGGDREDYHRLYEITSIAPNSPVFPRFRSAFEAPKRPSSEFPHLLDKLVFDGKGKSRRDSLKK